MELERCPWCGNDPLYSTYHDIEWGVPLHDEHGWYERIVLETMQAGLSWITVLRKRAHYRTVCNQFDPAVVSRYTEADVARLMADSGVIRNRAKIAAMIYNASAFLELQARYGSVDAFFWRYVDGTSLQPRHQRMSDVPAITPLATQMARDLKAHQFRFVGPTMCYALMQATGLTNDHLVSCHRHAHLA
ncbi:MAG: DNA-3-methyladenine glycosylase I [Roseiflexaceae bacterium]